MSRRPPSAREPRLALFRALPAVQRAVPGHLQARAAQPLPRPLPPRQVAAAGDTKHVGTGAQSTAVGDLAVASADRTVSLGYRAKASAYEGTAAGWNALATFQYGTAVGADSWARADYATAVGAESTAHGARSGAFGYGAVENAADACLMRFDVVEVQASSALFAPTGIILSDSTGQRWMITVDTTGHLTTTAL